MIGFKSCRLKTIPENALPENVEWLILSDNQIGHLPHSMGKLTRVRKLMLAGNRLSSLPEEMSACESLELLRLSSNRFNKLPGFLFDLPKLSWLAMAGNPLHKAFAHSADLPEVSPDDLKLDEVLGQGASGVISKARWLKPPAGLSAPDQDVAIKVFKGSVTSDGSPLDELNACLAAGKHPNLVNMLAQSSSEDASALVMGLIDPDYHNLGNPPSLDTCTRDTFAEDTRFSAATLIKIAYQMADILNHLHDRNICHGDIYAHNTLINSEDHILFGDFGAASNIASLPEDQAEALHQIEVRAFGCLLDDLLGCIEETETSATLSRLDSIRSRCMNAPVGLRPTFEDLKDELETLL
jgi:hypothetical protein